MTWNNASPGFSGIRVWEYSFSGSAASFDTAGTYGLGGSSSTQLGVALTLSGSNDVIIQTNIFASQATSSITTYGNFSATFGGTADLENTASGAAPTWTAGGSSTAVNSAIAFTAVP